MDQVEDVYNGMPATRLATEGWRKPWSGPNGGACVEALRLHDGRIALRQSTDPDGPALIYTHHEMERFIQGAKAGAADFLLSRPDNPNLTTSAGTAPERRAA
ncbi:DUF397 domain-containing protein [Streptomyces sp. NPDC019937]|uniref:DUF397 domain-containing protein n=1 Tax=Streptomyces sp. NPDC019937 TaxID=3154787 RepID=UPI00340527E0